MSTERGVVLRREDGPLLRGQGSFIDGLRHPLLEGALHAAFVRSTEPHATILGVDTRPALAMEGVVAVFTAAELNLWPLPPRLPMMNKAMVRPMLAEGVVRFVGEPVAMVVATDRYLAADVVESVVVHYQPLPALTDLDRSRCGELLLHPAAETNISLEWAGKAFEEDPFADCEVVVEFDLRHPRLAPSPIEPRAGAVAWGPDGRATVWVCSQRPAGAKYVIECSMGLEPGTVRAIAPDVGGGFGAKGGYGCYPEDVVATFAARVLGRPIRWCETRSWASG